MKLGIGEIVSVAGKGMLGIETKLGRKRIQYVILVLGLEENLLSVGQMMKHRYYILFGNDIVTVLDSYSLDNLVVRVKITHNKCFPLTMMYADQMALRASITHCIQTWHKRLGHLNDRSLKFLYEQEMVHGMPHSNDSNGVCE